MAASVRSCYRNARCGRNWFCRWRRAQWSASWKSSISWGNKFSRIFKTITVDNGSEFMDYEGMMTSKETGERRTQVFYCHPYRSNERGTNENQNRMFRRFFPKGTDLDAVPDEDISAVTG